MVTEYLIYVFGLCPTLLYGVLPQPYHWHFCKLVFATRIIHKQHKSEQDLLAVHKALLEFVYQFELLYYGRNLSHLHFVQPCIHALTHTIPEYFCVGSLLEVSQWTMEQTIGNLCKEIWLHSDPYANLGQRIVEQAQMNALYSLVPKLCPQAPGLPPSAHNIGNGYALLGPHELHDPDPLIAEAFCTFAASHNWHVQASGLQID